MDNKNNLPGLGPLWLMSLTLALGCFVVVVIPVSIATVIKPSDWIGFAGNVVAGAITLFAAILAWFAVQRQIAIQQKIAAQQIAIQQYTILQSTIAFLQEEDLLNLRIKTQSSQTKSIEELTFDESITWPIVVAVKQQLDKTINEMQDLELEFQRAGKDRWSFPESHQARLALSWQFLGLISAQSANRASISAVIARSQNKEISSEDEALIKAMDLGKNRTEVAAACASLNDLHRKEIVRLSDKVKEIRLNAGV
jgi:hypothetical protein